MLAKKSILCWFLVLLLPLMPVHALLAGAPVVPDAAAVMHDHGGQDHQDCEHCASHQGAQHMADSSDNDCHEAGCSSAAHCCAACLSELPSLPGATPGYGHVFPSLPSYGTDLPHEIEPPRPLRA